MAHASRGHQHFLDHPHNLIYRIPMKHVLDLRQYSADSVYHDAAPVLEIKRPSIMRSGGLSEAVKSQAAFWDVFNQIFLESTRLMGDS